MARYYNNPQIGAAFESISSMFAPPSGADAAGYATATARREEAKRLADFFAMSQDPNTDWAARDRTAFGIFGDAGKTFENADRTRAMELEKQAGINQTSTTNTMLAPVAAGATRFVPPNVASQYGVPGTQTGVLSAAPGERLWTADGRTLEGNAKPLTLEEAKAQAFQTMPLEDRQSSSYDGGKLQTIQTDRGPMLVPSLDAIDAIPADTAGGEKVGVVKNYYDEATGRSGRAVQIGSTMIDEATRQPLPPGAQVFGSTAQGTKDQIGVTNSNQTAAGKIEGAVTGIRYKTDRIRELVTRNPGSGVSGAPGRIFGFTQNATQVLKEMATSFGEDSPVSFDQWRQAIDTAIPQDQSSYDPVYAQVRSAVTDLAYAVAQANNPQGEVGVMALNRAMESLGQGFMANDADLMAVVDQLEQSTEGLLAQAQTLRGGGVAPLRPITGGPARPAPGAANVAVPQVPVDKGGADGIPTVSTPAEASALPPGTRFRTPDGRIKVRP